MTSWSFLFSSTVVAFLVAQYTFMYNMHARICDSLSKIANILTDFVITVELDQIFIILFAILFHFNLHTAW